VLFACLTAFLGWFSYRLWFYYGQLRSGEIVELPQYTEKFTASGSVASELVSAEAYTDAAVTGTGRPSMGPADAPLTVTVFADFECPFSKDAYTAYRALMAKYGDRVRFVYREHPLGSIHPEAMQAAMAAECAHEQGRFWVYHDKLFLNAPAFGFGDLVRYADEVGLEGQQFERCLAEGRYRAAVEADGAAALALGVRGTPTFFFNGRPVEGAVPQDVLEALMTKFIE
jgi:protein-disulfide isomerase